MRVRPWWVEQALKLLADVLDQGALEHQSRVDEIDHRNAVDIVQLQMLERRCRHVILLCRPIQYASPTLVVTSLTGSARRPFLL